MYNYKIKHQEYMYYCCCDVSGLNSCNLTLADLENCTSACDPSFEVIFQYSCLNESRKVVQPIIDYSVHPPSAISAFLVAIPFNQSELQMYNQVRICSYMRNNSNSYNRNLIKSAPYTYGTKYPCFLQLRPPSNKNWLVVEAWSIWITFNNRSWVPRPIPLVRCTVFYVVR